MSGEFTPEDNFDGGNYNPQMGGRQNVHSFGILGQRVHPDLMAATEARRHGLGWQRLIGELVDVQHDLSPSNSYNSLKIICNAYAFMMCAIARCPMEHIGHAISLETTVKTDYQEFTIGSIIRKIALKAGVEEEAANAWQTMDDVDKFMQTAERPVDKVEERSVEGIQAFLAKHPLDVRLSFVFMDGQILSGYLKRKRGRGGYGILKRSDSTTIFPVELERVKLIQSTTHPIEVLYPK